MIEDMLKSKLIKSLCGSEKLLLLFFISLYLALQLLNIKLPGLYVDEAFPACGSLQMIKGVGSFLPSIKIFNINFPVMLGCEYETALESYILLPFFWLFGVNVIALRLVPILAGAVMLLFLYFFLKEFFDKKAASFSILLLIINSVFLLETKLGLNSASMFHWTGMAALWSLFRWYKGRKDRYLYWGIFLLGLGISIRVWFLWFVNGMIFSAMIFLKNIRLRLNKHFLKYNLWGIVFFCLGIFLFIFYNLDKGFPTIKFIITSFKQTTCGVDNSSYFHNLYWRLTYFIQFLNGSWPLKYQGCWIERTPLKYISTNPISFWFFTGCFIWLIVSTVIKKPIFSVKRVLFILMLFMAILFQSPFTLSSLGGPHLFVLFPLVQIITGAALADVLERFRGNKIILTVISCIFLIFILLECNTTIRNNYLYFERTGGTGNESDAVYPLARFFEDRKIYKPIVMDWGIYHNLIFLSQGKIIPYTFRYVEDGKAKDKFIEDLRDTLKDRYLYIFHSQEFANRPEVYPIFEDIAKVLKKDIKEEAVFYQRDNRPVFIIYSVK